MIWLYLSAIICTVILLASAIPIIQFLSIKKHKIKFEYIFPEELYNYDMDSKDNVNAFVPREFLATRGWIRGPQGNVMTEASFQEKKKLEYENELP